MTNHDGWPSKFNILPTPVEVVKSIGHFIYESVSLHQLSSHGDHFQHPLDVPVEPVTDWPDET